MTSEFAVELRDVVKKFVTPEGNELNAVDHVSMQIKNGEFFSMLGSSGCGKTTSLRMIAGFEWPTEGEVYIEGRAMGHTPPFQRKVNTVFQSYALFQHMTVAQNIAFGLEMEGVGEDEIKKRVGRALEMVQLTGMERRRPKQLSGGQQQRVAVARALVKTPSVLLLDEPLGALDLKLRKEMQLELKALQQQLGITFIYVTHDQEEALTMSDRIAVMSKGKVQQLATPVEIYERPSNKFVADFIGESNFLEGTIKSLARDEAVVFVPALNAELRGMPMSSDFVNGEAVAISVRPEKIRIAENNAKGDGLFEAKVLTSVYIGSDTHVYVDMAGIRLKVMEQNRISRLDPSSFYTKDQIITLLFMPENTLVLKKD
ncbi:MAG: spermidine/putrescine ABC transporter ATP-binding protein [Chloroflexi bacterium]|nr:Vitamin B12 import ATP-binding protein BtuD [Anaerolineales bacterium]MCE7920385.1 ABC transporter ATP-binding protein [Chloroflexi bacterium CFX1]MCQ3952909.1 spermidine/putrescine ABC transporter ATP-binding protein [Chloroflexota bacterium]MDL1918240.1 ABC transporter ATP-binding protein [Chloroflexi bacterium CFX5]MCK6566744.1 ABC transporter ATP-binding protein [Anaerolineales bacterium]